MVRLLKLKEKMIKTLSEINAEDPKINKLKLEICFMLMGYYTYKNDIALFDTKSILKELNIEIARLLNISYYDFFAFANNSFESFSIAKRALYFGNNEGQINDLLDMFDFGYNFCKSLYSNFSVLDALILRKEVRVEKNLMKIMQRYNESQ